MIEPTDAMKAPFQAIALEPIRYAHETPERWNGIPDSPDQDGWHWIRLCLSGQGQTGCYLWEGAWWWGGVLVSPEYMTESFRTEYLGPAVPPDHAP